MTISLLTGGDVAPMRPSGRGLLGDIAGRFARADVSFFNLELPLSERGAAVPGKAICMRGLPANVDGLTEAGVTCVNLANNHILDYGEDALFDTLELLEARAVGHFGAGRDLGGARRACIVAKNGLRVGFLGYTTTLPAGFAATAASPGVNPLQVHTHYEPRVNLLEYPGTAPRIVSRTDAAQLQGLRGEVAALAGQADVVIVYVHWGTSMSPHVHDFQREIGHAAIDAGARAVFGGHQHVLSAIEFYRDAPIVHGSGNLLFDIRPSFFTGETLKTFLFGATLTAEGLRDCHLMPVATGVNAPPRLLASNDPRWHAIHEDLQAHSSTFGTELAARGDAIEVRPSREPATGSATAH